MHQKVIAFNAAGRRIGESHPRAKLTDEEVEAVLYLREAGLTYAQIAAKWDEPGRSLSVSTVRDICTARRRCQTPAAYRVVDDKT